MKNMTKKQKIVMIIIALIILVGTILTFTIGLNYDLRFQEAKKVVLYINKEFEVSDVRKIVKEVIPNQEIIIQKVEVYEDSISITAKEITEEQKQDLVNKINEKYNTELSADSIEIVTIPHTRGRDIVKPYVVPFVIATAITLVYIAIRYYKLGAIKTVLKTALISVLAQIVLLDVIAITRIPVGRLTIPMVITVYMLTLIGIITKLEKKLENKNKKESSK